MGLLERLEKQKANGDENTRANDFTPEKTAQALYVDEYRELKDKAHKGVIEVVNKKIGERGQGNLLTAGGARNEEIYKLIEEVVESQAVNINRTERTKITNELYDEVMGYGPLEPLLKDDAVSEIMVNGPNLVYIEKAGKLFLSDVVFRNNEHVMNIIDRIVSSIGRHVDESSPMVDARLADGSRVNVIIPPLSLVGPVITIRKFSRKPMTDKDLIRYGSISLKALSFLEACVRGKMNIVVSGGTGSGKTTLLNVLSGYIPENERIVTIEDAAELRLNQRHVITLESRPSNLEGTGQITIRDLVRNALRMRPDRIVVGEVRSGETLDMLQAMNTGHDGSLTTAHANTPRDLLSRLETMVLMAGMDLPIKAIREQISSAIDIIVQQSRMRDGSRKITKISEISGMEGDIITMQDIYTYETDGTMDSNGFFKGRFSSTGIKPMCVEKLKNNGIGINDEWFRD
ncbi:MAG: CpaF family protein [Saccharofermentanales bacterium]